MNNLFNFKSYFKFLGKHKFYTLIEVIGLSASLMFVMLIASYVLHELSVDRFHEKKDRIVVLGNELNPGSNYHAGYRLMDRYPEIENVTTTYKLTDYGVNVDDNRFMADILTVDTTFFDLFSFRFLEGNAHGFRRINDAIITRSFANRAFRGTDPIGKRININDSLTVTVNGVIADPELTSFGKFEILLPFQCHKWLNPSLINDYLGNATDAVVFLLLHEGADLKPKAGEIAAFFREFWWFYQSEHAKEVRLTPLSDLYFGKPRHMLLVHGDKQFVLILISVGLLILIFSVINYINLSVALSGYRAKEMATRRLLGSSRTELFARLMLESLLLTVVSTAIGMGLALIFLPYANNLLQVSFHVRDLLRPLPCFVLIISMVSIGLLCGLLPASMISSTKPIDVVKGSFRYKTKMLFSKFFITFQNVITVALLTVSFTMLLQIRHLINAPLGYATANRLVVYTGYFENQEAVRRFGSEVGKLACVNRLSYCSGTPFSGFYNNTIRYKDRNIGYMYFYADSNYIDILGLTMIKDNHVTGKTKNYLNEEALRQLEMNPDAVDYPVNSQGYSQPIAGVVKDYRLGNITGILPPVVIRVNDPQDIFISRVLVETNGDPAYAFRQIERLQSELTGLPMVAEFIDQQVRDSFGMQRRITKILILFTVIAVILSTLGLIAMSTYFIHQRTKEVSIRKVFGSTNREVLKKLVLTFLNYSFIAFFIATPISWYLMKQWLEDYTYRISLSPLIFVSAGFICLVLAFATVFWQSWKAANTNPIEGLRGDV